MSGRQMQLVTETSYSMQSTEKKTYAPPSSLIKFPALHAMPLDKKQISTYLEHCSSVDANATGYYLLPSSHQRYTYLPQLACGVREYFLRSMPMLHPQDDSQ